ncbi:hypothetical protein U1Q18_028182, partial [Sarracenia purpurea var. burkii]
SRLSVLQDDIGRDQKKAAAAAKRGGKATTTVVSWRASATDSQNAGIVENLENGVDTLQVSDRTCMGVPCSHPLSK